MRINTECSTDSMHLYMLPMRTERLVSSYAGDIRTGMHVWTLMTKLVFANAFSLPAFVTYNKCILLASFRHRHQSLCPITSKQINVNGDPVGTGFQACMLVVVWVRLHEADLPRHSQASGE